MTEKEKIALARKILDSRGYTKKEIDKIVGAVIKARKAKQQ